MFAELLDYAFAIFVSIALFRFKYILGYNHSSEEEKLFDSSIDEEPFLMMLFKTVTQKA